MLAFFADGFVVAFFADAFVVAFFADAFVSPSSPTPSGRAFFADAFVVAAAFLGAAFSGRRGDRRGHGIRGASGASAGTIGSAPMSGVERRLARSPDARAAPAARAP